MAIKDWSTTASENNATAPNGFPEGMLPSQVNDSARQVMADIRAWYESPIWIDFGYTVAQASANSFTVSGADATTAFSVGRRVKLVGGTTVYGEVSASSYSDPNTTVTVTVDSGSVPADLSSAFYSAVELTAIQPFQDEITGAATSIVDDDLATSRALVSDGSGKVAASAVTATELGFLDGVTSSIQTQLGSKAATGHTHTTSDITNLSSYTGFDSRYFTEAEVTVLVNGKADVSHTHAAADVISGVFSTARLGSGTASTSTFLRGDGSWASLPDGTVPAWGEITGTLSNQSDLNVALNAKQNTITGAVSTVVTSNLTSNRAVVSNSSGKVVSSAVTDTEIGFLDGVTSNIQVQLNGKAATSHNHSALNITSGVLATDRLGTGTASSSTFLRGDGTWAAPPSAGAAAWGSVTGTLSDQTDLQSALNAKQDTITGAASTVASSNLTVSRALVSNSSGKIAAATATSTEVGYLSGVTSAIQTQLNAKEPTLASNRKRQIFVQSTTPAGPATGDLWVW